MFNLWSKLTVVTCSDIDIERSSISFNGRRRHIYRVEGALEKTTQCRLSCWCIHNHCLWKSTTIVQSVGNCVIQYDTILMCSWNLVPLNKNTGGACVVPTDISRRSTRSCKDSGRKILKASNEKSCGNNYLKWQLLLLPYISQLLKLEGQLVNLWKPS